MLVGIRRTSIAVAAVAALVVTMAGCSDEQADPAPTAPAPTVTQTVEVTPTQAPSSSQTTEPDVPDSSASPEDTPDSDEPESDAPDGEEQSSMGTGLLELEYMTVEIKDEEQRIDGSYAGTLVEVCVTGLSDEGEGGVMSVEAGSWSLEFFPGGETFEAASESQNPIQPVFPDLIDLAIGDCVEGWISFESADHAGAIDGSTIRYQDAYGQRASWNFH
ncbi:hypothetical protein [Parenemella sanctibonifatiensis]|uniref:hypothetical protein n=1 Tax=Parenemella sanctibonifatiensis TaxID=2016505 RepID=UPI0015C60291|nr:hypothetical protein [Parenemella sanctibonifatiensis]